MMTTRRMAQSAKRMACLVTSPGARYSAPCVLLVFFALLAASGCSYFRPHLTAAEVSERLQYSHDRALEELVGIAMARGYRAVDGEGQPRQVLELDYSNPDAIHRLFFEVHPRHEGLTEVFFLENRGSVVQTQFIRFPRHLRKAIREFLEGLPKARSEEYRPLLIRQEKLSRSMIAYEWNNGARAIQFTQKVAYLEKSNLYGLFHLSAARFLFFGKKSKDVFRTDYLEADERHKQLVEKFLKTFRPQTNL